jgi:hypothetical protein
LTGFDEITFNLNTGEILGEGGGIWHTKMPQKKKPAVEERQPVLRFCLFTDTQFLNQSTVFVNVFFRVV